MDTKLGKKRKLKEVDTPIANGTVLTAKKSKGLNKPPPVEPTSEDEDDENLDGEDLALRDAGAEWEEEDEQGEEETENGAEAGHTGPESAEEMEEDDGDGSENVPIGTGPLLPPTTHSELFRDLNLSEKTMKAIEEVGFTKMTQIQRSVCVSRVDLSTASLS